MNEFERLKCIELTNRMSNMDLCRPFKEKVDPVRDGAPGYFDVVKHPMDLSTVRKSLNTNEYKTISEWSASVNQIWTNAMLYNHEGTLIYLIALEMKQWFAKKLKNLPRNKDEEWLRLLRKSSKRMSDLSQHPPPQILATRPPTPQIPETESVPEGRSARREIQRPPSVEEDVQAIDESETTITTQKNVKSANS
jgi:hypothetical protein